ncbi:DUF448 domain-containing protein [Acetobacteraceae bacterium ESL0709]|nr:DUF448 domain-containing protein [Acetobacteraceae bacterium ESL0697]MDF7677490.1 DUF448 domain-containing protein [Acetobacteraceae bacterium ESL0709]
MAALSNTDNLCDFDDGPVKAGSVRGRSVTAPTRRRCVVTRDHEFADVMIRFVMGPEGQVVPDFVGRLPGRGLWVKAERNVLDSARLGQAFSRAARKEVRITGEMLDLVRKGLANRLRDGISLARRAGEAVCGFQKCREKLVSGEGGILLCALGASQSELDRLRSGCRSVPVGWVPEYVLASAFGRDQAVYAVVVQGALAQRLVADCKRFSGVAETSLPDPDMGQ